MLSLMAEPRIKHATLVASTKATLSVEGFGRIIRVISDSDDAYFTISGTDPTVKGDDCYRVLAGGFREVTRPAQDGVTAVEIISGGTPDVTVELDEE